MFLINLKEFKEVIKKKKHLLLESSQELLPSILRVLDDTIKINKYGNVQFIMGYIGNEINIQINLQETKSGVCSLGNYTTEIFYTYNLLNGNLQHSFLFDCGIFPIHTPDPSQLKQ